MVVITVIVVVTNYVPLVGHNKTYCQCGQCNIQVSLRRRKKGATNVQYALILGALVEPRRGRQQLRMITPSPFCTKLTRKRIKILCMSQAPKHSYNRNSNRARTQPLIYCSGSACTC